MKKGPIHLPYEALDRTIEYLEGAPGFKRRMHKTLWGYKAISYLYRANHFDSVADFFRHESELSQRFSRVAFEAELEVKDKVTKKEKGKRRLELLLGDNTGNIRLVYPYSIDVIGMYEMPPDPMNNPVHGSEVGERIRIYDSLYLGGHQLQLQAHFHIMNDSHYRRMRETREAMHQRAISTLS